MSKSDYLERALLDHRYGGADYVRPATVYVALYTVSPTDAGGGTECAGNGYARVAMTNNAVNWPAASGTSPASKSNGIVVNFPAATADWMAGVDIVAFGILDNAVAGNLLDWAPLTDPKPVFSGDVASFAAGTLVITED